MGGALWAGGAAHGSTHRLQLPRGTACVALHEHNHCVQSFESAAAAEAVRAAYCAALAARGAWRRAPRRAAAADMCGGRVGLNLEGAAVRTRPE